MYDKNPKYQIRQNKILWLNTNKALKTSVGAINTSFTWDINPLTIYDYATLRIESITHFNTKKSKS